MRQFWNTPNTLSGDIFLPRCFKRVRKWRYISEDFRWKSENVFQNGTRHYAILYALNVKSVIMFFVEVFGYPLWVANFLSVFIESVLSSLSPGAGRIGIDIIRRHLIFGQSLLAAYTNRRILGFILMKCHQVSETITVLALKCRHQYAKELI